MVTLRHLALCASLCSGLAHAVTAEELRAISNEKERAEIQRRARAQSNALGPLLVPSSKKSAPEVVGDQKPASAAAAVTRPDSQASPAASSSSDATPIPVVPAIRADGNAASPNPRATVPAASRSMNTAEGGGGRLYVPPSLGTETTSSSSATSVSDAVAPSNNFGIRMGSWLVAALQRNTTSGESGTVELAITEPYVGDRRTLPAGTVVFAEKVLNMYTKRMEMVVRRGITPQGKEFEMEGVIFDTLKTPGLAGVLVLDKKQVANAGLMKGAIAAVGSAAATGLGANAQGTALRTATQSITGDVEQANDFNNGGKALIYVSPQKILIRVERQF